PPAICFGAWSWLKKSKFPAFYVTVLQQYLADLQKSSSSAQILGVASETTPPSGRILVDLTATIHFALQKHTLWEGDSAFDTIHSILLNKLCKLDNVILYIDGKAAAEKDITTTERWKLRLEKLKMAAESIHLFESAITNATPWPGKEKDRKFRSNLQGAWYLSPEKRKELGNYLESKGWKVQHAKHEADVALGRDCRPNDIVVSTDSDMLAYDLIQTIARPFSGGRFMMYKKADIIRHMRLDTVYHLQALAVVSRNDYSSNIRSMGFANNVAIIRTCKLEENVQNPVNVIILKYLASDMVQLKNVKAQDFNVPLQVFVGRSQKPSMVDFSQYATPRRHKTYQTHNAYRTVEPIGATSRIHPHNPLLLGQDKKKPHRQRFAFSEVLLDGLLTYVTPDQAESYCQLKKNPYRPPTKNAEGSDDDNKDDDDGDDSDDDDDDDDDDEEDGASVKSGTSTSSKRTISSESSSKVVKKTKTEAKPIVTKQGRSAGPRLKKKRELSKLHPTRSLKIGSLKLNMYQAHTKIQAIKTTAKDNATTTEAIVTEAATSTSAMPSTDLSTLPVIAPSVTLSSILSTAPIMTPHSVGPQPVSRPRSKHTRSSTMSATTTLPASTGLAETLPADTRAYPLGPDSKPPLSHSTTSLTSSTDSGPIHANFPSTTSRPIGPWPITRPRPKHA
ncbi:hypothetical protein BG000_008191, partial [Podila horticola]